jgi:uncharacterized protein (TIGR02147 family)
METIPDKFNILHEKSSKALTIFDFTQVSEYLNWALEKKQKRNPAFSVRAWARRLGFKNNSPLSLMLAGKRHVPQKYILAMAEDLDLNIAESRYFSALVELSRAKTYKDRFYLLERLHIFRPKPKLLTTEIEPFDLYEDPLNGIIVEMTFLKGFKADIKWIQKQLRFAVPLEQVDATVKRLFKLGFLKIDEHGQWIKSTENVVHSSYMRHKAIHAFHRNIQHLVSHIIFDADNPVKDLIQFREIQSYSLSLKKEDLPKVKEIIWDCVNRIINETSCMRGQADEVYQFNLQFVPLTQAINDGTGTEASD